MRTPRDIRNWQQRVKCQPTSQLSCLLQPSMPTSSSQVLLNLQRLLHLYHRTGEHRYWDRKVYIDAVMSTGARLYVLLYSLIVGALDRAPVPFQNKRRWLNATTGGGGNSCYCYCSRSV